MRPNKTPPSLKARALRLLAGRDYGMAELERKLAPHAESAEALAAVLAELHEKGFISDERAAASLLYRRADKLGSSRLLMELRQKGFADDLIAEHAEGLRESEAERAQAVWQKRFGHKPQSPQERAKQMRFLASRGFAGDVIGRLMRSVGAAEDEA